MLRKLFSFVHQNGCKPDDPDSPMMQEILLPGHLYLGVLAEKLQQMLYSMKTITLTLDSRKPFLNGQKLNLVEACKRESTLTNSIEYFLATGNLVSKHGLGILQTTGFAIIADKLNYWRYLSHFRSVHRGAVFTEIRTTSVRKLTPESWGFLCPVHTPDGGLCGLLNHLTFLCEICTEDPNTDKLIDLLISLGMIPLENGLFKFNAKNKKIKAYFYDVLINGQIIGYVNSNNIDELTKKLRYIKALACQKSENKLCQGISKFMEICQVPRIDPEKNTFSLYPGLYIFTSPGRMMRPVKNLTTQKTEYIGTMEQCYLHICVKPEDFVENVKIFKKF